MASFGFAFFDWPEYKFAYGEMYYLGARSHFCEMKCNYFYTIKYRKTENGTTGFIELC